MHPFVGTNKFLWLAFIMGCSVQAGEQACYRDKRITRPQRDPVERGERRTLLTSLTAWGRGARRTAFFCSPRVGEPNILNIKILVRVRAGASVRGALRWLRASSRCARLRRRVCAALGSQYTNLKNGESVGSALRVR